MNHLQKHVTNDAPVKFADSEKDLFTAKTDLDMVATDHLVHVITESATFRTYSVQTANVKGIPPPLFTPTIWSACNSRTRRMTVGKSRMQMATGYFSLNRVRNMRRGRLHFRWNKKKVITGGSIAIRVYTWGCPLLSRIVPR